MTRRDYWLEWYQNGNGLYSPSGFAKWVLGMIPKDTYNVVDAGAGNLRDSSYFMSLGMNVTAVDWATGLDVLTYDYSHADLVYARWLIHALDDKEESIFLSLACKAKYLAIECRSSKDPIPPRLHGHFRRPVDVNLLKLKVLSNGMDIKYCEEKRGWSVDGMDDPLLIRLVVKNMQNDQLNISV